MFEDDYVLIKSRRGNCPKCGGTGQKKHRETGAFAGRCKGCGGTGNVSEAGAQAYELTGELTKSQQDAADQLMSRLMKAVADPSTPATIRAAGGELLTKSQLRRAHENVQKDTDAYLDEVRAAQDLVTQADQARGAGPQYERGVAGMAAAVNAAQGNATSPWTTGHNARSQIGAIISADAPSFSPGEQQPQLDFRKAANRLENAVNVAKAARTASEYDIAMQDVTVARLALAHIAGVR